MNRIVSVILLSSLLLYQKPGDLGHPRSSYELGSALSLHGNNVIVSMFADTVRDKWTDAEKEAMLEKLSDSCAYISRNAEEYDVDVSFTYDWSDNPDLCKKGFLYFDAKAIPEKETAMDNCIQTWLDYKVNYEKLSDEYEADNIFMLVFVKTKGRAYAITYDGIDNPKESVVVYQNSSPCVIAHEILHLYGAHDYYKGAEYTDDVVEYIKENYPNEIMLVTDEGNRITKNISAVTAYHLGWLDDIPEIDKFPQLSRYEQ